VADSETPYYRRDLALVHHNGFAFHAAACAAGILRLLEPVREREGLVLEIGCGSGLLTQELVAAGHRVIASDASPSMLELANDLVGQRVEELRQIVLPDDPLPEVDAVVGVGHPINYLPDLDSIHRALVAAAAALRPGGVLATDLCDLQWGVARLDAPAAAHAKQDWAMVTRYSQPSTDRFVRDITTFLPNGDGSWRRDDEHHENVLVDTATVPDLLLEHEVEATCRTSFGEETLPEGLVAVVGRKLG
jgi:SAM-dependent methyltransferase